MKDKKPQTIAEPLKSILTELKQRLEELYGERLSRVILYGSRARGDAEDDSDIDILVVLKGGVQHGKEQDRISYITSELGLRYLVLLSTLVVSEEEVESRRNFSFFRNVQQDGVAL